MKTPTKQEDVEMKDENVVQSSGKEVGIDDIKLEEKV